MGGLLKRVGHAVFSRLWPAPFPKYEQALRDNYRRFLQQGSWIADVGAHDGLHTREFVTIAGTTGRVAAFEPLPYCYHRLRRLERPNVMIENVALSNYVASAARFTEAAGTPQESGLKQRRFNHPDRADPREILVEVTTLDRMLDWRRLDYLKIDIEGAELDCLAGGERLISRCRPIISFECGYDAYEHYGKSALDFLDFGRRNGFVVMDLFGNDVSEAETWMQAIARMWDFYFVPSERAVDFVRAIKCDP